ncbi:hypothetical protein J0H58_03610, partial [bacterium]|nr:hypothetical protein [bacterium]
ECLTGRPPFKGADALDTLDQVRSAHAVAPRELQPRTPRDLETVALKCLEKDPGRRYPTAAALAADLGAFLAGRPVAARPAGPLDRTWRWCRRNSTVAALVGGVLLASLTGTGVSLWYAARADVAAEDARREKREADRLRNQAITATRDTEQARGRELTSRIDVHSVVGLSLPLTGEGANPAQAALWFARAAELAERDPHREWANRVRVAAYGRGAPTPVRALLQPNPTEALAFHPGGGHLLGRRFGGEPALYDLTAEAPVPLPGGEPASAAAWSGDGRLLAVGTPAGRVRVFEFPSGRAAGTFDTPGEVSALTFGSDGRHLAVAGTAVRVWDLSRNAFVTPPLRHGGRVAHLAFCKRGDLLVTSCDDGLARCFAVPGDGAEPVFPPAQHRPGVAWSLHRIPPLFVDDDRGLMTHAGEVITCRNPRTGTSRWSSPTPLGKRLEGWAVSPDGHHLAVGVARLARFYTAAGGVPVGSEMRFQNCCMGIGFSPDGAAALVGSLDRTARLWSAPDGRPIGGPANHPNDVVAAAYSPTGHFVTGQRDGLVRVWRPGAPPAPRLSVPYAVGYWHVPACVDPAGRHVVAVSAEERVARVHALATGQAESQLAGLDKPVRNAAFSPDGARVWLLTAADIRVWDWRIGGCTVTPLSPGPAPDHWAISPDGRRAVLVYRLSGRVEVRATADWGVVHTLHHPNTAKDWAGFYSRAEFSPSGRLVATFGMGSEVRVWEVESGREVCPPLRLGHRAQAVSFSPDEEYLATASLDLTARVWDVRTGGPASSPLRHSDWVHATAFDPTGTRLATGCRDGTTRVWDWRAGRTTGPHFEHADEVYDLAWVQGGRVLFTGTRDGHGRAWDASSGMPLTPPLVPGHAGRVSAAAGHVFFAGADFDPKRMVAYRFDEIGFAPNALTAPHLRQLAELNAGQAVAEGGGAGLMNTTSEEWLERWRAFRHSHPDYHALSFPAQIR